MGAPKAHLDTVLTKPVAQPGQAHYYGKAVNKVHHGVMASQAPNRPVHACAWTCCACAPNHYHYGITGAESPCSSTPCLMSPPSLSSERRPITIIMAYHRRRVALFKYALPHVAPLPSERRPITIIMAYHTRRIALYALPHHLDARNHIVRVGHNLRGALCYVKDVARLQSAEHLRELRLLSTLGPVCGSPPSPVLGCGVGTRLEEPLAARGMPFPGREVQRCVAHVHVGRHEVSVRAMLDEHLDGAEVAAARGGVQRWRPPSVGRLDSGLVAAAERFVQLPNVLTENECREHGRLRRVPVWVAARVEQRA